MASEPETVWQLETQHLGREVHVYSQLDSTNTLALSLGNDPGRHGLAILARAQSAGRGQHGRTWLAPADSSVLLSLLLFAPNHLRRPALLTAWAAVSVCNAILQLSGSEATIKWPNDVLLHGKKVCGILIEQRNSGDPKAPLATVVGIGLNVTQPADFFVQAGLPFAASLASTTGKELTTDAVTRCLLRKLDEAYGRLAQGDQVSLEADWKARLGLIGKSVVVEGVTQTLRGRLVDVTLSSVVLEIAGNEVVRIVPEAVRHIKTDSES